MRRSRTTKSTGSALCGCTSVPTEQRGAERCARRYDADECSFPSSLPTLQQQPGDEATQHSQEQMTCWARVRVREREREAESTRRREGLLVCRKELQQLELFECRERRRVVDRPRWYRSPAASEPRHHSNKKGERFDGVIIRITAKRTPHASTDPCETAVRRKFCRRVAHG